MAHLPLVFIVFFFFFNFSSYSPTFSVNYSLKACSSFWVIILSRAEPVRDAIIRASTLKIPFENWKLIRFENYNPVEYRQISHWGTNVGTKLTKSCTHAHFLSRSMQGVITRGRCVIHVWAIQVSRRRFQTLNLSTSHEFEKRCAARASSGICM